MMAKFIESAKRLGWPARADEMMEMLGVNPIGCKWPDAGVPMTKVQGVTVWVEPKSHEERSVRSGQLIRAMCVCPDCKKTMAVGRLWQHSKSCSPRAVDGGVPARLMHPASVWKTDTE
jgi:hypothetical protein